MDAPISALFAVVIAVFVLIRLLVSKRGRPADIEASHLADFMATRRFAQIEGSDHRLGPVLAAFRVAAEDDALVSSGIYAETAFIDQRGRILCKVFTVAPDADGRSYSLILALPWPVNEPDWTWVNLPRLPEFGLTLVKRMLSLSLNISGLKPVSRSSPPATRANAYEALYSTEGRLPGALAHALFSQLADKSLILRKAKACLVVELKDLLSTRDDASEALCLLETGDLVSTMPDLRT